MEYTQETFVQLFETIRNKKDLIRFVKTNPKAFVPLFETSIVNTPEAWRSSWLIGHTMEINDNRIKPYVDKMIEIIPLLTEGHQRQTIIILLNMFLNDLQEGKLFHVCLSIWEQINIIPSTRVTALKFILKIAEKHPELKDEVTLWTQEMYLETLSPGIKNSVLKQIRHLQ